MSRDRLAILSLGALVAGALILALIEIGGPARGALERRDDVRLQDIMRLQSQIICLGNRSLGALPETLETTDQCDYGAATTDPISGEPYGYEPLGDGRFRLCATFEDPDRIADRLENRQGSMDEDGCLVFTAGR